MYSRLRQISAALAVGLFCAICVHGQEQAKSDCDFSRYRPLVITDYVLPVVKKVEPEYPLAARAAKISGTVWVKILVNKRGDVVKACAEQGHPLLASSAQKAALQWKFAPNFGLSVKSKGKAKLLQYRLIFDFNTDK